MATGDVPHPCPNCGHCPTCGRYSFKPVPVIPQYPWWGPVWISQPTQPTWVYDLGSSSGIFVGGLPTFTATNTSGG